MQQDTEADRLFAKLAPQLAIGTRWSTPIEATAYLRGMTDALVQLGHQPVLAEELARRIATHHQP